MAYTDLVVAIEDEPWPRFMGTGGSRSFRDGGCVSSSPSGRTVPYSTAKGGHGRSETVIEHLDRNWDDILLELRVAQTGVQLLTGPLLTVPFQSRFRSVAWRAQGSLVEISARRTAATAHHVRTIAR